MSDTATGGRGGRPELEDLTALPHARSFGSVVDAYDHGRPGYPDEAVAWLVGRRPLRVLELGAGTGKLTRSLLRLGHRVHASEPDAAMAGRLTVNAPDATITVSGAEEIPAEDASVDVVVAAQAFHWFDHARSMPEIARVLAPGGRLSLVWNHRDETWPPMLELGRLIGSQEQLRQPTAVIDGSGRFGPVAEAEFSFVEDHDLDRLLAMVTSRSTLAVAPPAQRAETLAGVTRFHARHADPVRGLRLPYLVACYRAVVREAT